MTCLGRRCRRKLGPGTGQPHPRAGWDDFYAGQGRRDQDFCPPVLRQLPVGALLRTGVFFTEAGAVNESKMMTKAAVEAGTLSHSAKCSTSASYRDDQEENVICIYCPGHQDRNDLMRGLERLRDLGVTRRIPFNTDDMTRAGRSGSLYMV